MLAYVRWRATLPDLSGLPEEQAWRAFAKAHHNRCALCRVPDNERVVDHDHDHTTGLVRGLLCRSCNRKALPGIPHMALSRYTDISPALALYCQWPPTSVAGQSQPRCQRDRRRPRPGLRPPPPGPAREPWVGGGSPLVIREVAHARTGAHSTHSSPE
ncbi:endonuclease domain-containing protein [Streptosporangium sandarakinum]